ncbi:MAG: ribosome silencing factor [Deferrisomatales bacterium]|nr:ribosome silencing factor [Deferrisomatales bacterium]
MTQDPTLEHLFVCARAAADKRAADLLVLDVRKLSSFTDYFLIASGSSDRRVQSIAEGVLEAMARRGRRPLGAEGVREGRWALLDFGDWVVHVFYEDVRRAFDLEGLWFDAERVELPAEVLEQERPSPIGLGVQAGRAEGR